MNLLADESVDGQIVERLRREGHDVLYVAEMESGITDDVVLRWSNDRSMLLITADKDFGELVFRQAAVNSGVLLLRLGGLLSEKKAGIVADVLRERAAELPQAFSVISPGMVRIRHRLSK